MTTNELRQKLANGRWGGNRQLDFGQVISCLIDLPVAEVELLSPDRLRIVMTRPLTIWEAFILGRFNPDDPPEGIGEEQAEFIFWWD